MGLEIEKDKLIKYCLECKAENIGYCHDTGCIIWKRYPIIPREYFSTYIGKEKGKMALDCWVVVEFAIKNSQRTLLHGPPGTGKTWCANRSGVSDDMKIYNVTLTPEMSSAELRGHYVPQGSKFIWRDGVAITAWREGARLVLNEINEASGDVQTLLHAILDDMEIAGLTLPTGEFVRPKEGFHVIATMNGVPDDLPPAIKDRFPLQVLIDKPAPPALEQLPLDLRALAKESINLDPKRNISIRIWNEFARIREVADEDFAFETVFGKRGNDIKNAIKIRLAETKRK